MKSRSNVVFPCVGLMILNISYNSVNGNHGFLFSFPGDGQVGVVD